MPALARGWLRGRSADDRPVERNRGDVRVGPRVRQVGEHRFEVLLLDGLLGDQSLGQLDQAILVLGQHIHRPGVATVDDRADFLVDLLGDVVRVVALLADLAAEEDELVALAEGQRAELARSCRTR